jgi:Golgi transport complex subunit 5
MSDQPSYIDYEAFLSPDFSPQSFANTLILSTNNPTDTTLDLSTPLSRVLFDVQEIDTHIHNLTTKAATPIIDYVKGRDKASKRILGNVEGEICKLRANYERLEKEVLERYEEAERARLESLRSLEVLRLGREVGRAVGLGRQLEIQISEGGLNVPGRAGKEDHRALVRAVYTIFDFKGVTEQNSEGRDLQKINIVKTLKTDLFAIAEERIKSKAQQIIREFSISNLTSSTTIPARSTGTQSSPATFLQTEDAKSRTTSAITILYLLSPTPSSDLRQPIEAFQPTTLLTSLQTFLQNALTSSLAAISRALTTLPTLDRTLLEVSARCQNVVALEALLLGINRPPHPLLTTTTSSQNQYNPADELPNTNTETENEKEKENENENENDGTNLLAPLLTALDTSSLPSYFWRSLASALSPRVQEILNRGGVSARTLRSNREKVGIAVKECVIRGSEGAVGVGERSRNVSWEREAAVMVGCVVGGLGR